MNTTVHLSAMPAPPLVVGEAPLWVHLVPAGTSRCNDGRGPFVLADAAAVIEASMADGKIVLDENHSTDFAAPQGRPSPARGWIVEMQARDDGIWGRMEWTSTGRALMADGAYRGISPVIVSAKQGGRIIQILRASLTNNPAFGQLTTLHSQESPMDLPALRQALGLAADADEAAILAAARDATAAVTRHAGALASVARAAGVAETATSEAIVTALAARRSGETTLEQQVIALQSRVTTLTQASERQAAETAVDAAIRAGKPISPLRDRYVTRHMADPAGVADELAKLPSIHGGGLTPEQLAGGGPAADGLSPEERLVCTTLGISTEDFKKARAAEGRAVTQGAA